MHQYRQNLMASTVYTCNGYCYQEAQDESGRSMVEMLGVLAVIGVLSVAGIAGYSTAVARHHANELLNEASKRAVIGMAQLVSGRTIDQINFGELSDEYTGYGEFSTSAVSVGSDSTKIGVKVSNV